MVAASPAGLDAGELARTMAELLDQPHPPTAVFCTNDMTAFGVVDAIRERSLTLGVDVSVLGYDDLESEGYMPFDQPILTTLRKPRRQLGQTAARLLIEQPESSREIDRQACVQYMVWKWKVISVALPGPCAKRTTRKMIACAGTPKSSCRKETFAPSP